jgi:predicted dehydrogenase
MFNVGIIGLGMIGESMLGEFIDHPAFNVYSVWDINDAVNKRVSDRYPKVRFAKDAKQIIEDPHVHLVYIATPPTTHIEYAWHVVRAKKVLFCEKPLAINLADSRALVDAVEEKKIITAMNFIYGAGSCVDAIENELNSGSLGAPQSIEIRYQFPSWPLPNQLSAADWITKREQGGMIREMFSHFAYLIHRLFGPLEINSTLVHFPEDENASESFALASLRTGSIPVWLMGGICGPGAPRESELTVHGTLASLRLCNLYELFISDSGSWRQLPVDCSLVAGAQARLGELAQLMAGGASRLPDIRAGLHVQEVVEKMLDQ